MIEKIKHLPSMSRAWRCALALLLGTAAIASPVAARTAAPRALAESRIGAAASITQAFLITAASYNAWDPNTQSQPQDNDGAAFPSTTRKVGIFFRYSGANVNHDTYRFSLTTGDGTEIGLGKTHTFTSASGGQALLLTLDDGYTLTPGSYKAVLFIDGVRATTLPWTVGGRVSSNTVPAAVTIVKSFLITKQSFNQWDPNAGGNPVADMPRVFAAADRAVGIYFIYNGARVGKDTFQFKLLDAAGAAIGVGKVHTFDSVANSQALLLPVDDGVTLHGGTYKAVLLVDGSSALTFDWTIAGTGAVPTAAPVVPVGTVAPAVPCKATSLEQVVACVEPSVLRVDVRLKGGEAQGTSFVIRDDASGTYLLTNRHVIEGASPATTKVIAPDGTTTYPVAAILANTGKPGTAGDLAIIKIAPTKLRPLAFGNSATLSAGQTVASIGYGLAFELAGPPSVTQGIISAVNRNLNDGYGGVWIQHQSTINHGNSGGPLLDLSGNVVGVNTLSIDQLPNGSGSNEPVQGVFFAIPANNARTVASGLVAQLQGEIGALPHNSAPPYTPFKTSHFTLSLPSDWIVNRAKANQPFVTSRDQLVQILPDTLDVSAPPSATSLHNVLSDLAGTPGKIKKITFIPIAVGSLHGLEAMATYAAKPYTFDAVALSDAGAKRIYVLASFLDPQATTLDHTQYKAIVQSLQAAR